VIKAKINLFQGKQHTDPPFVRLLPLDHLAGGVDGLWRGGACHLARLTARSAGPTSPASPLWLTQRAARLVRLQACSRSALGSAGPCSPLISAAARQPVTAPYFLAVTGARECVTCEKRARSSSSLGTPLPVRSLPDPPGRLGLDVQKRAPVCVVERDLRIDQRIAWIPT
jgi:hypothetical protein